MNKIALFAAGLLTLIIGMALVMRFWSSTVIVFEGVMPAAVAVLGLVLMFAASLKR